MWYSPRASSPAFEGVARSHAVACAASPLALAFSRGSLLASSSTNKGMKWRVVDDRTTDVPSYNTFYHANSKLGRQHTKAPLAAALSPFVSLLYPSGPWCEWCDVWRLTTLPGSTSPTRFEQWCGFFYVPQKPDKCKCCETGPTVFRPYPSRLESLTVCWCCITKAALSSQLFKDPECWSGRGSNPWPPAQQTGALPTELTRRR